MPELELHIPARELDELLAAEDDAAEDYALDLADLFTLAEPKESTDA